MKMKKLIVLLMILGISSVASAGLVPTVAGKPMPSEITINMSDEIELDLEVDVETLVGGYLIGFQLSNGQAEFLTDRITFPFQDFMFKPKVDATSDIAQGYAAITAGNFGDNSTVMPETALMKGLYVHCLDNTDVTLTVLVAGSTNVDNVALQKGAILGEMVIHQIPEPMTIALLGLGGLFLRRRK
jgi:hypothetical protein